MSGGVKRLVAGSLAVLATLGVASDAEAGVSNPGTFDFIIEPSHDSLFRFTTGKQWYIDDGGAGYMEADIDNTGYMTSFLGSFGSGSFTVGSNTVTAQLQIVSSTDGVVDVTNGILQFNLTMKVHFAVVGGSSCNTGNFSFILSTANWASSGAGACTTGYDESTGDFCVFGSGFTVPQLAASACGSQGNAINSAFNLGVSTGSEMQILVGNVSPIVHD